jgi:hypothetical protein
MNTSSTSTQRNLHGVPPWHRTLARAQGCLYMATQEHLLLRSMYLEHFGPSLRPLAFSLVFELTSLGIVPSACYFCSLYAVSPILLLR